MLLIFKGGKKSAPPALCYKLCRKESRAFPPFVIITRKKASLVMPFFPQFARKRLGKGVNLCEAILQALSRTKRGVRACVMPIAAVRLRRMPELKKLPFARQFLDRGRNLPLRSRNFVTPLREKIREYPLSHILRPSLALGELLDRGTVFLARKQAHEVFPMRKPRQEIERKQQHKAGDHPAVCQHPV